MSNQKKRHRAQFGLNKVFLDQPVWVKFGTRWYPAQVWSPEEVPVAVVAQKKGKHQLLVKYFNTPESQAYQWVHNRPECLRDFRHPSFDSMAASSSQTLRAEIADALLSEERGLRL